MRHNRHVLSTMLSAVRTGPGGPRGPPEPLGGAVEPTQAVARRSPGRWLILLAILLSALTLSGIAASPAMAEEVSTASASEEPAATEDPAATEEPAEEEFE